MLLNKIQAIPNHTDISKDNKTYVQTFSRGINTNSTSSAIINEFPELTIQGNKNLLISISVPCRSDDNSWGGMFITTNIKVNGTWHNLGNSGYDGNIMIAGSRTIGTYVNSKIIDLRTANILSNNDSYRIAIELVARSYSGVGIINPNVEINDNTPDRGNTSTMLGSALSQNFTKVIIQELDR
jgi:hypothetical protein